MSMSRLEMGKFSRDIEKLMEEHKTHPGIMLFQPRGSNRMYCMWIGTPAVEWISKAGEGLMKSLENNVMLGNLKGTGNGTAIEL